MYRSHSPVTPLPSSRFSNKINVPTESGNGRGPAIHNRRPFALKMEEKRYWRTMLDQRQWEEVVLLQDILPLPQGYDMGTRSLPPDRVQESKAVLAHFRGRGECLFVSYVKLCV